MNGLLSILKGKEKERKSNHATICIVGFVALMVETMSVAIMVETMSVGVLTSVVLAPGHVEKCAYNHQCNVIVYYHDIIHFVCNTVGCYCSSALPVLCPYWRGGSGCDLNPWYSINRVYISRQRSCWRDCSTMRNNNFLDLDLSQLYEVCMVSYKMTFEYF